MNDMQHTALPWPASPPFHEKVENHPDKTLTQTIRACLQRFQPHTHPHVELIRICLLADPSERNLERPGLPWPLDILQNLES